MNQRLRFTIWLPELWSRWCALQAPVQDSNWCVPNWGYSPLPSNGPCFQYDPSTNDMIGVDCGRLALCIGVSGSGPICACTAAGCVADFNLAPVEFDMALSGTGANGSITGQIGDHNIRLTRDP